MGLSRGDLQIPEVVVDELGGGFHHNGADDPGGPRQRSIYRGRRRLVHLPVEQPTRVAAEDGTGLVEEVNMAVDDGDGARHERQGLRGIRRGRSWAVFLIPIRSALGGLRGCECVTHACKRGARHGGGANELPARNFVAHRRFPSLTRWLWQTAQSNHPAELRIESNGPLFGEPNLSGGV